MLLYKIVCKGFDLFLKTFEQSFDILLFGIDVIYTLFHFLRLFIDLFHSLSGLTHLLSESSSELLNVLVGQIIYILIH